MTTTDEILTEVRALDFKLTGHIEREEQQFMHAFPNGDIAGHRKAHESMIEAAQEQARFWRELRLDMAKKGLWGLVVLVVGLIAAGGLLLVATKLGMAGTIRP